MCECRQCVCAACSSISIASYWLNLALEQLPARFGFSHAPPQPPYSARGMNFSKSQHTHTHTHSESERRPMRPGSYLPICSLKCRTMREITMQPKTKQRNMNHFWLQVAADREGERWDREGQGRVAPSIAHSKCQSWVRNEKSQGKLCDSLAKNIKKNLFYFLLSFLTNKFDFCGLGKLFGICRVNYFNSYKG